jgi:pimeloyl-ACP methyl ester carboxylesterase
MNQPKPEPPLDLQFENVERAGQTVRLAFVKRNARHDGLAGLVWLGGFRSDLTSSKATAIDAWAGRQGAGCLRFDYSGHGRSEGRFEDATIGLWLAESLAMIRAKTAGPQILIGSSMGGWIALLAARALETAGEIERLRALVLIAPAVDFTERLMFATMKPAERTALARDGVVWHRSAYAPDPYPITQALISEGRNHLLFDHALRSHCPVHILQGMQDPDVPWQHAMVLVEHLAADPTILSLIRDGDHRLSREQDVKQILAAIESFL